MTHQNIILEKILIFQDKLPNYLSWNNLTGPGKGSLMLAIIDHFEDFSMQKLFCQAYDLKYPDRINKNLINLDNVDYNSLIEIVGLMKKNYKK